MHCNALPAGDPCRTAEEGDHGPMDPCRHRSTNLYGTFETLSMLLSILCCIGNLSASFLLLAAAGGVVELDAAAAAVCAAPECQSSEGQAITRIEQRT